MEEVKRWALAQVLKTRPGRRLVFWLVMGVR